LGKPGTDFDFKNKHYGYNYNELYSFCSSIQPFMNALQTELGLIKNRFPAYKSVIEDLYRMDSDFKSLCADLFLCSKMIQDFEVEITEKQHALVEYREIVKELENELSMVIKGTHTRY
jgi:archaellum component FlaC